MPARRHGGDPLAGLEPRSTRGRQALTHSSFGRSRASSGSTARRRSPGRRRRRPFRHSRRGPPRLRRGRRRWLARDVFAGSEGAGSGRGQPALPRPPDCRPAGDNEPPSASDDTFSFVEDEGRREIDLVGNDTDPDGDTLEVSEVQPGLLGRSTVHRCPAVTRRGATRTARNRCRTRSSTRMADKPRRPCTSRSHQSKTRSRSSGTATFPAWRTSRCPCSCPSSIPTDRPSPCDGSPEPLDRRRPAPSPSPWPRPPR